MNTLSKYHARLTIPVAFQNFEPASDHFLEKSLSLGKIPNEFRDWLRSLDIVIQRCIFFCSPPNRVYRPHVDGQFSAQEANWAKINIIFNSSDTVMTWYRAKDGFQDGFVEKNTESKLVRYWNPAHCDVLHQTPVNESCLINGTVIHDLKNGPNNGMMRSCYSMWIKDYKTGRLLTWEAAVDRLANFIV